jgi:exodeoxyribonuclease VII small subunit
MAKDSKTSNADVAALPFEKALAELETIVQRLEKGDVALEESIRIYERGEALKKRCDLLLREAEARVEKIARDAQGRATGTQPLDPDD